jgi:lipopolysaccharide/colanic/teichoic acid biosynthesis glycosyltransferase
MEKLINILYIGSSPEKVGMVQNSTGISLTIAENMLKAVNFLKSVHDIDAIFCNVLVPGGDGFAVFDWVSERPKFDPVPFILVAQEFREDVYKTAFVKRIDDFYVAPLPPTKELSDRIQFLRNFRDKSRKALPSEIRAAVYKMPFSKRMFDVAVAGTALIILSPILLPILLAIRLESKGKVYYTAKRVGRKPFDFYKLRSMRTGSDADLAKLAEQRNQYSTNVKKTEIDFSLPCPRCSELPAGKTCSTLLHIKNYNICDYWYNLQKKEVSKSKSTFIKILDDPRITRVGKLIRNTSIDELPQLVNVIKGDMSIVGNRPLPVYEAEILTRDDMSKRFLAPAGITGLWQVELRGKGGNMSEDERKRLDNEYADHFAGNNYSFWYDLKLILRTVPALFQKDTV